MLIESAIAHPEVMCGAPRAWGLATHWGDFSILFISVENLNTTMSHVRCTWYHGTRTGIEASGNATGTHTVYVPYTALSRLPELYRRRWLCAFEFAGLRKPRPRRLPRDRGRSQDPQDGDSVSAFCRSCNEDRGPHRPHATHCTHLCRALSRACPQSKSALVGLEVTVLWAAGPQERMPACTRAHSQCAQAAVGSAVGSALATGYRSATAADRPPV